MRQPFIRIQQLLRLLVVTLACSLVACSSPKPPPSRPNVIFIVLDTLRADHLGVYGYQQPTSPQLDAFAAQSTLFEYAVTAAPWTPPSVSTMITGLYPIAHGMMPPDDRRLAKRFARKLGDPLETMAERLKAAGYHTGGLTSNPWTNTMFGFAQGYDSFLYRGRARGDEITTRGLNLLDALRDDGKPFLLYLHYLDPHDPYDPPAPYVTQFPIPTNYPDKMGKLVSRYDGEIRFMDGHLGRLFAGFRERGVFDSSLIIVVGDHGEQFREHGHYRHGFMLHNEELHVPLIVKFPGQSIGTRVQETASTIDILPTVLKHVGLPADTSLPGVPLDEPSRLAERPGVLSEIYRNYDWKSITNPQGKKLILKVEKDSIEFDLVKHLERWHTPEPVGVFDRSVDYLEKSPLDDASAYNTLRAAFEIRWKEAAARRVEGASSLVEMPDEAVEQLRSLGYLK